MIIQNKMSVRDVEKYIKELGGKKKVVNEKKVDPNLLAVSKHMEEKLQGYNFYRVHKSYLVNLDYVEELIPSYNNGYAMKMKYLEEKIPISRTQVKNVRNLFVIQ